MYPKALVVLFFALFFAAATHGAPLKQFKLERGDATPVRRAVDSKPSHWARAADSLPKPSGWRRAHA
ncbi:hypothetical protein HDZ31DRAFT_65656 [Schizophyllum fasciatum]